jgi:G:T-mismatch repair DNA endonuclease (very short patch repair protein)
MPRSFWSEEEVAWLEENYASNSIAYCAEKLNRSLHSVQLKASRLKIKSDFKWSQEEINYLIEFYPLLGAHKVGKFLNLTPAQVAHKAADLGVKRINGLTTKRNWTPDEDAYISKNAHILSKYEMSRKLGIDRKSLVNRANDIGVKLLDGVKTSTKWNVDHVEFLHQWYGKMSIYEISSFVNKNASAVIAKARRDGLSKSKKETLPEQLVKNMLKELNLYFEEQVKIKGTSKHVVYTAYFLLDNNIIIEVQGDYYHCNPALYPNGPINPDQESWVNKDNRKRNFYELSGYQLLEIWESELRNTSAVKAKIKQFVQSRQTLVTEF